MHRSHKSNVTKDAWHFLFVLVFTVEFSKSGHFSETHCKDAVSEAYWKQKMVIFHDWQILVQTVLRFILVKIESNEQDK